MKYERKPADPLMTPEPEVRAVVRACYEHGGSFAYVSRGYAAPVIAVSCHIPVRSSPNGR